MPKSDFDEIKFYNQETIDSLTKADNYFDASNFESLQKVTITGGVEINISEAIDYAGDKFKINDSITSQLSDSLSGLNFGGNVGIDSNGKVSQGWKLKAELLDDSSMHFDIELSNSNGGVAFKQDLGIFSVEGSTGINIQSNMH